MRSAIVLLLLTHVAAAAPRKIEITTAEARQHRLSHEISIDLANTSFSASKFRKPDIYLTLSGPPGGPLGIDILDQQRKLSDTQLQSYVELKYDADKVTNVATVKLAGRNWRGVAWLDGAGMARTLNVYLVDGKGLAIHLDIGAGQEALADSDVALMVAMKPFAVLKTLSTD